MLMVDNMQIISKTHAQTSIGKSTYESEFIPYEDVIREVLSLRELVRSLDYKVTNPSWIFYDNKSVVVAACSTNIIVKKRSTAMAFH